MGRNELTTLTAPVHVGTRAIWSRPDLVDTSLFTEEEFTMPGSHPIRSLAVAEPSVRIPLKLPIADTA